MPCWTGAAEEPLLSTLGNRLVPSLLVRDLRETLEFYALLGCESRAANFDPVSSTWAEVSRDGITLQLYTEPPHGTPDSPVMSGTLYIYPENVLALAEEWRGKVPFAWAPEVMDYGMREFGLRDPNGYYLAFTEPA